MIVLSSAYSRLHQTSFLPHFGHSSSFMLAPHKGQTDALQFGQRQFAPVILLPHSEQARACCFLSSLTQDSVSATLGSLIQYKK